MKTRSEKPKTSTMQTRGAGSTRNMNVNAIAFADHRPQTAIHDSVQKMADNSAQAKDTAHLQYMANSGRPNLPGLPENLKVGIQSLSGYAMDDVRDEAWHVVQQKQGRVKPTVQMKADVPVNDDPNAKSDQPFQLAKYTVKRNFPLAKGIKAINKKEAEKDKPEQSAKSRAKGELYAVLRSQYPLPPGKEKDNFEEQEKARGEEYLIRRKMIDDEFEAKKITDEQESVDIYRAALTPSKEEGARAGSSQADGVSKYLGIKMIGAHLVKREWGGSDNMWNVVAWPQAAEDKWANEFEQPIDNAATWGLEPGEIDIEVEKDDETISKMKIEPFIEGAILNMKKDTEDDDRLASSASRSLAPHFMDPINRERHKLNRIIETVPRKASGTNNAPSITTGESKTTKTDISSQETEYAKVYSAAVSKLKTLALKEIKGTSEQDALDDQKKDKKWTEITRPGIAKGWKKKNSKGELPDEYREGSLRPDRFLALRDSDEREKGKRATERASDWDKEKNAYDSDKFELKQNVQL